MGSSTTYTHVHLLNSVVHDERLLMDSRLTPTRSLTHSLTSFTKANGHPHCRRNSSTSSSTSTSTSTSTSSTSSSFRNDVQFGRKPLSPHSFHSFIICHLFRHRDSYWTLKGGHSKEVHSSRFGLAPMTAADFEVLQDYYGQVRACASGRAPSTRQEGPGTAHKGRRRRRMVVWLVVTMVVVVGGSGCVGGGG
jgi:hypothetical protein